MKYRIGVDERPVFPESYRKLVEVGTRDEGAKILKDYGSKTGIIYN
jgi:hypothetical protein